MAHSFENDEQGYDERRFQGSVKPDLLCSICQEVLRNPKACQNNEHPFCFACILKHLEHSPTCPECIEHLTPETLKNPPRFLMSCLLDLKINCDYKSRGCNDYIRLENLQNHIDQCEFAPVMCEKCGITVNRKDKDSQACTEHLAPRKPDQFPPIDCENEGIEIVEMNRRDKDRQLICHDCKDLKRIQERMKFQVSGVKESQGEIKERQNQMNEEMNAIKVQILEINKKQDEINNKVMQLKENVGEIKHIQAEMKVDEMMFKTEVRQQFQRMNDMLNLLLQGANRNNKHSGQDYSVNNNPEIIIMGGWSSPGRETILNTVEIYNITNGKSMQLPCMNHPRVETASCVFNNDVIVAGGYDGCVCVDHIEILQMDQYPLRWTVFQGKLPSKLSSHSLIVYHDKLLAVGGMNSNDNKTSNVIHEISLIPPHTVKKLFKMSQARRNHRTELVNDKLYVFGGTTTGLSNDATDSVVCYDIARNERKRCEALPYRVCGMSTVTWGSMVIVIGGADKNDQVLADVIMYETVTGKAEKLPNMIYRRYGSSAVILDDVIYVMGGWNQAQGYLNSVECLTIGNDFWVELPGMRERRRLATAVVKPRNLCR